VHEEPTLNGRYIALAATIAVIGLNAHAADVPPPPAPELNIPRGFETRKLESFPSDFQRRLHGSNSKSAAEAIPEAKVDARSIKAYVRDVADRAEPWRSITPRLAFAPVDLENTVFGEFSLVGGIVDGSPIKEGFAAVKRVFRSTRGETLVLFEWAFQLTGGGGVLVEEFVNGRVGKYPAIITILTSPDGNAVTRLFWATDARAFRILIDRNLEREARLGDLIRWATAITEVPIAAGNVRR
jgi:hypothetical protein